MRRKRIIRFLLVMMAVILALPGAGALAGSPDQSLTISGPKKVTVGKKITLTASFSVPEEGQRVKWKSSDEAVATVSSKGVVRGVSAGKVKITAVSVQNKKVRASITVTVKDPVPETKYYALLIGNGNGYPQGLINLLPDVPGNLKALRTMLKGMSPKWNVTLKQDLGADEIISAIHSAFRNAKGDDVCMLIYSGHGVSEEEAPDSFDAEQGGLVGVDLDTVSGDRLARALSKACPGRVIVILDSCGSGSLIRKTGASPLNTASEARRFTEEMASAFAAADRRSEKTGNLRKGRFTVLAACGYRELTMVMDGRDPFIDSLLSAAGCGTGGKYRGSMPADTDQNRAITLKELYTWASRIVSEKTEGFQHVKKYGDDSAEIFLR